MSCSWPRVMSPTPGRSTLMTSAPNQASSCVQVGPDCTCVKSRILTPSSALLMVFVLSGVSNLFLLRRRRVQARDAAALGAGAFVDHRVDQGRLAGRNSFVQRLLQL